MSAYADILEADVGVIVLSHLARADYGKSLLEMYVISPYFRELLNKPGTLQSIKVRLGMPYITCIYELCVHLSVSDPDPVLLPNNIRAILAARHNYVLPFDVPYSDRTRIVYEECFKAKTDSAHRMIESQGDKLKYMRMVHEVEPSNMDPSQWRAHAIEDLDSAMEFMCLFMSLVISNAGGSIEKITQDHVDALVIRYKKGGYGIHDFWGVFQAGGMLEKFAGVASRHSLLKPALMAGFPFPTSVCNLSDPYLVRLVLDMCHFKIEDLKYHIPAYRGSCVDALKELLPERIPSCLLEAIVASDDVLALRWLTESVHVHVRLDSNLVEHASGITQTELLALYASRTSTSYPRMSDILQRALLSFCATPARDTSSSEEDMGDTPCDVEI